MTWVVAVVAILLAITLVVVIVGMLLPRDHVAMVAVRIPGPRPAVWDAITDPSQFPQWRPDIVRVEILAPTATGPSWREFSKHNALTMVVDVAEPPNRLIMRIADKGLPFDGTWEYLIEPDEGTGSRVTVTERGSVYNPIFRFVSRFIFGHTATIDAYLRALGARFGADVTPIIIDHTGASRGI